MSALAPVYKGSGYFAVAYDITYSLSNNLSPVADELVLNHPDIVKSLTVLQLADGVDVIVASLVGANKILFLPSLEAYVPVLVRFLPLPELSVSRLAELSNL